jgi:hypothetical protein
MPRLTRVGASARKVARVRAKPRIKIKPPPREDDPFAKKTGRRSSYYTTEFLAEVKRSIETTTERTTAIAHRYGIHHSMMGRLVKRYGWVRPEGSSRVRGLSPVMRLAAEVEGLVSLPPRSGGEGREQSERGGGLVVGAVTPPTPDPSPPRALRVGGGERAEFAARASHEARTPTPDPSPQGGGEKIQTIDRLEAAVLKELGVIEAMRASLRAEPMRPMDAERTARTLSVLTETLSKLRRLRVGSAPQSEGPDDDIADIDEFRLDLARRIDAFVASRTGGGGAERDRDAAREAPLP